MRVLTGSTLTLVNQARSHQHSERQASGSAPTTASAHSREFDADGNTGSDLQLTFGTRADLQTLTFGTYTCDATVLVRGTSGIVCPH